MPADIDDPTTLIVRINAMKRVIEYQLEWQQIRRDKEQIETTDDTAIISPSSWPTRGCMKRWSAMLTQAADTITSFTEERDRLREAIYEIANASGSFAGRPDYEEAVKPRADIAAIMAEHGLTWADAGARYRATINAAADSLS